jgi:predicted KAP-like P-loop ATPase
MILHDNETKIDFLNNEAIAKTIITMLREHPERPVTLGVHGDWGAGKSSVLEMIEAGFADDGDVLCLKFNGWRFQGFEDAKIALIEGIVNGLVAERSLLTKAGDMVKAMYRRIDFLKLAKNGVGLAWFMHTGIPTPGQVHSVTSMASAVMADPTKYATKEGVTSAMQDVKDMIKPANADTNVPKEVVEFREAFDALLKKAGIKQLVVLVDDLDRCLPETAIETLEAIRLFIFTSQTAFVIAADEAMIEYAVRKHFPDLPDTTGPRDYARNYLEKLIQVPFRIPALGETETRIYVTLLLVGSSLGDDDADFQKLIAEARERLKRPWANSALDAATVKTALGASKAGRVQDMLTLSDQIAPILAHGTRGNPRQIKRFLNALVLRKLIAEGRGFGDDVALPILAKLMLAERFIPALFDQIASAAAAAPDGKCSDLNALETRAGTKPASSRKTTAAAKTSESADDGAVLTGWLSSESICEWAAIEPKIGDVDLRPYLFVAKDKKDYFGGTSALGKLAIVAQQLLGPKISVQGMAGQLKLLAAPEAAQVFEEVRTTIMSKGAFDTSPSGVDGLVVLVTAHPTLESSLLDFLEGLPTDHLGTWAVAGWSSAIRDGSNKARLQQIVERWSGVTNNAALKTAATATLTTLKTNR